MKDPKRCNLCGKELDFWDDQQAFVLYCPLVGYGSKYDGDSVQMQLCCDCFDKLVDHCKINPAQEYDGYTYYPKEFCIGREGE